MVGLTKVDELMASVELSIDGNADALVQLFRFIGPVPEASLDCDRSGAVGIRSANNDGAMD